jgi:uncharacterized protein YbjT (DUF2867 family)
MKIAVTTPTGHVGSSVVDYLLDIGGDITIKMLGRRPERLNDFVRRGAEVAVGSLDDVDYVTKSTRGVDAIFWGTPPAFGSDKPRDFQNRLGTVAANAIRANNIPRVVNLSSIGANLANGAGPVSGLHDIEGLLNDACPNVTHLRAGFFFENLFWQLDSIRNWGRISLPLSATQRYPMLATRDIGRVAATRLVSQEWTGHVVQELHGPVDMNFKEVAAILGDVLGRKIVYVKCDPQEARDGMIANGMSEAVADMMLEMYDAIETGKMRMLQPRSEETTTTTTFADFARESIVPRIHEGVAGMRTP